MAIKKDINDSRPTIDRNGLCWSRFSRNQKGVLRIELRSGKTFLLPYMHWGHAHFERVGEIEELTIKFHSQTVRVEGQNLRELLLALQASNVELLREIPEEFGKTPQGVMIDRIEVQDLSIVSQEEDAS